MALYVQRKIIFEVLAMKNALRCAFLILFILASISNIFADYHIRQQIIMDDGDAGFKIEQSIWVKGQRERSESKILSEGFDMSAIMPPIAEIMQCDLRQTVKINDANKRYFIEPFVITDDKPLPPEPATKSTVTVKKGGTVIWAYTITDTGERRQMFGFTARRLIVRQLVESGKDACDGEQRREIVEEGWFAYIIPESARCDRPPPRPGEEADYCIDKFIRKGTYQYPGLLLDGTRRFSDLRSGEVTKQTIKTLEVSKANLEMALFEIPVGYTEANSMRSLTSRGVTDNVAKMTTDVTTGRAGIGTKPVGIDFFAGNVSKIDQNMLRQYLAGKFSSAGKNAVLVASQSDLTSGAYVAIIGLQIKSVKESGAAKIGGLFGKITGNDDAAKIGESEAEIVITAYAADGKTLLATGTARSKVNGKPNDAMKAAIDDAFGQIVGKIK